MSLVRSQLPRANDSYELTSFRYSRQMRKEEQEADGIEVTWGKSHCNTPREDRSDRPTVSARFQGINNISTPFPNIMHDWEICRMSSKSDR